MAHNRISHASYRVVIRPISYRLPLPVAAVPSTCLARRLTQLVNVDTGGRTRNGAKC